MTGVAALAFAATFTSCSKTDLYDENKVNEEKEATVNEKYAAAFEKAFGKVGANVDWGFSSKAATRANSGENYPATSGHINANANEWAASTTGDNPKTYGGWIVPDPLTPEQKERVAAYFKANPNLEYKDPEWRHFFVQNVYKGTNSVTAANGSSTYTTDNMTDLYVGPNKDEDLKINNFSQGDATEKDVLDNFEDVNTGSTHKDKIMLMVNIDNTETFTYFNSATSSSYNNKCALVSAAVIDEWAEAQNPKPGAAVSSDKWNRQFLGFDLALLEGSQCYDTSAGNASLSKAPENPNYAWDGEKIIDITNDKTIKDKNGDPIGYIINAPNWYQTSAADDFAKNISQTQNVSDPSAIPADGIVKAIVLKEFTVDGKKYQSVVNLPFIKKLVDAGYLPTNQDGLTNWVKVAKSDGYFDDWIVTLTKAERKSTPETHLYRVIAEDLSATEAGDFDFNDVVFDVVKYEGGKTTLRLIACGGTLPLTVGGVEVHSVFGEEAPDATTKKYTMFNTIKDGPSHEPKEFTVDGEYMTPEQINTLPIVVTKDGVPMPLTATKGVAACKILVDDRFPIVPERTSIANAQGNFTQYVQGHWNDNDNFWWIQTGN